MTNTPRMQIRDGVAADIAECLSLDHTYETHRVWQIRLQGPQTSRDISLREEKLPRPAEIEYPKSADRLTTALAKEHAFIVAADNVEHRMFGYVILSSDAMLRAGFIRDIVVDRTYRRAGIATRLLRVAGQWARRNNLQNIYAETQTVNYPAIKLFQRNAYTFCGFNDRYFQNQDIAIFFHLPLN